MCDEDHKQRFQAMCKKILEAEKENLKSPKSDPKMVDLIRKIIIDEASKRRNTTC